MAHVVHADNTKTSSKLANVQALRAFAALWVVLFHTGLASPVWAEFVEANLVKRGYLGVDLFFVISGFIIAWVAILSRDAPEAPMEFLAKRFFRLAPPYWLVACIFSLICNRQEWETFANTFLFAPFGRTAPYFGFPALYVGWTLNYEVAFYLVCAGSLLFGRLALAAAVSALLGLTLALPLLRLGFVELNPAAAYPFGHIYLLMVANPLMLEFAMGMGVAALFALLKGRVARSYAFVLLIAAAALYVNFVVMGEVWFSTFYHGIPSAILLLAFLMAEDSGLFVAPKWAVTVGEWSFGIYLLHPVVIEAVNRRAGPVPPEHWHYAAIRFALVTGLTLWAAKLLYVRVEVPCIQYGRKIARVFSVVAQPSRAIASRDRLGSHGRD